MQKARFLQCLLHVDKRKRGSINGWGATVQRFFVIEAAAAVGQCSFKTRTETTRIDWLQLQRIASNVCRAAMKTNEPLQALWNSASNKRVIKQLHNEVFASHFGATVLFVKRDINNSACLFGVSATRVEPIKALRRDSYESEMYMKCLVTIKTTVDMTLKSHWSHKKFTFE